MQSSKSAYEGVPSNVWLSLKNWPGGAFSGPCKISSGHGNPSGKDCRCPTPIFLNSRFSYLASLNEVPSMTGPSKNTYANSGPSPPLKRRPFCARLGSQEERRAKSSEAPICADGHHKLSARSAVFCRIFASNLVDLVLGELLPRHAGRIAGFPEKAVQARRRYNPEQ